MATPFQRQYRDLERRMRKRAEDDGDVFLPNPEPTGPVDYVLICMEPSLGGWAKSPKEGEERVNAGFRNFLAGIEPMLLHFSVRKFLCKANQSYHVTDFSKGAMLVKRATHARSQRYAKWYDLLRDELELIAKPGAKVIAVGKAVHQALQRNAHPGTVTPVIHYSSMAGKARKARLVGYEDQFETFRDSVSHDDVISTARDVLLDSAVPSAIYDDAMAAIQRAKLTESRRKLIFAYKLEFESLDSQAAGKER